MRSNSQSFNCRNAGFSKGSGSARRVSTSRFGLSSSFPRRSSRTARSCSVFDRERLPDAHAARTRRSAASSLFTCSGSCSIVTSYPNDLTCIATRCCLPRVVATRRSRLRSYGMRSGGIGRGVTSRTSSSSAHHLGSSRRYSALSIAICAIAVDNRSTASMNLFRDRSRRSKAKIIRAKRPAMTAPATAANIAIHMPSESHFTASSASRFSWQEMGNFSQSISMNIQRGMVS